jgi:uncharacterized protein YggL (DUF469 family)
MKTAMQELIDEIQYYKEKESLGSTSRDWLILIETIAINKLEKEKEQIIEASRNSYIAGYLDNQCKVDESMNFPEEYYNQTYNRNK